MQQVGAAGLRQLPLDLEHDVKEDGFSDEDASEVVDWEQGAARPALGTEAPRINCSPSAAVNQPPFALLLAWPV